MSEEKKPEDKKVNKLKEFLVKIKEVFSKVISHPLVDKNINYISFLIILILLIFVRLQIHDFFN